MKSNTIYPPMSEREISGAAISREAATQGMVLLKNINGVLPLKGRGKIALFGNGAARTIRGGTGSGDPFNGGLSGGGDQDVDQSLRYHINILNAMETEGFEIVNREQQMAWARCYDLAKREMKDQVMSVFAFPEEPLTTEKLEEYAKETETAICVISRNSGEGNDRFMKKEVSIGDKKYEIGDYRLSAVEMDNLKKLRSAFSSLVLVLNVPGSISVQDLEAACADAILLMGQAGQEGGAAVTDILTGKATPSGKLTATWAKKYEDYPTAGNFLQDFNKAVYTEGIYVGYRYFDTFNVDPGYPFGYGLSYTTFALGNLEASLDEDTLVLGVTVENTGAFAGREVVQVYVSAPVSEMDMPEQELKGFQKTMLLAPGEKEDIKIRIPLRNLASYSENAGGYILSKGDYGVRIGTSSRDTKPVCKIRLEQTALTEQVLVELSYAIGIAEPLSIYVETYNSPRPEALKGMTDGEIARRIGKLFDLRPAAIVKRFGLKNPIFEATASYGHFGNRPYTKTERVWENGAEVEREIEFFGWEKLDAVEQIKREFGL